jgi:hypothetical protein
MRVCDQRPFLPFLLQMRREAGGGKGWVSRPTTQVGKEERWGSRGGGTFRFIVVAR